MIVEITINTDMNIDGEYCEHACKYLHKREFMCMLLLDKLAIDSHKRKFIRCDRCIEATKYFNEGHR